MELAQQLLQPTIDIVKRVGGFIRNEGASFDIANIEKKGFNDLVSYVDKEAERQLVEGLEQILPKSGFITEEGTSTQKGEKYNWVIDPLDGTTNFTHGLPIFSISVALLDGNELVLGVVYEINRDECFYSAKGLKAFCNTKEISVSPVDKLADSLLATGFPYYNFNEMEKYLKLLDRFMQTTHGLRRMGSAAVDLAYVACGRFQGFFEYNLNAYDVAAGAFLVKQAGGFVSDFQGGDNYLFGRQIVAACNVHAEMSNEIKKYWYTKS